MWQPHKGKRGIEEIKEIALGKPKGAGRRVIIMWFGGRQRQVQLRNVRLQKLKGRKVSFVADFLILRP